MGKKHLLGVYQEMTFEDVKATLSGVFLVHVLILLGFSIMFISFLKMFHFEHFWFSLFVLVSLSYFIIQTLFALIELQKGIQESHLQLIRQYRFLFLIAYSIIVPSEWVLYEALFLIAFLILFYALNQKNEEIEPLHFAFMHNDYAKIKRKSPLRFFCFYLIETSLLLGGATYFLYPLLSINWFYWLLTPLLCVSFIYFDMSDHYNGPYYRMELYLLQMNLLRNPSEKIANVLKIE